MAFAQQRVIITGGSSGIGKALARQLSAQGASVDIIARNRERLEQALEEIRAQASDTSQEFAAYASDVSDYETIRQTLEQIIGDHGVPDLLINSAGIAHPGYFEELPLEVFHQTMQVNFFGTLYTTKVIAPMMMERHSGTIVNICSIAGFLGVFGYTAYGASKFAVRGFTDVLRSELKPYGVHVAIVFPPDTDTPQLAAENKIKPVETRKISGNAKVLSADQVASAVLKGIRRHKYVITPGFESSVTYFLANPLSRLFNWFFDRTIAQARRQRGLPH